MAAEEITVFKGFREELVLNNKGFEPIVESRTADCPICLILGVHFHEGKNLFKRKMSDF